MPFNIMDYHSIPNQKILGDLVHREVLMNAGIVVDALQQANPNWFEAWDIDNLYVDKCPECNEDVEQKEDKFYCDYCKKTVEPEQEMAEVYEYWFITNWFADKLRAHGEVIINDFDQPIWGRCASGQAILLDGVIGSIAEELEILDGQKYAWNSK